MNQISIFKKPLVPALGHFSFIMLFGVIAMLASSCQKDNGHIKKTVPLNAVFKDTATVIVPGSPGVLEQHRINGWGSGTPIGKSTFEDIIKINTSISPAIINGMDIITTANGDKIFSTSNGYFPDPDEQGNYEVFNKDSITGGTGKFAGATGSFTVTVIGNFSLPVETATYAGTITY